MGISLVRRHDKSTGALVENEIFGPVLPIIAVEVGFRCSPQRCDLILLEHRRCYPVHQRQAQAPGFVCDVKQKGRV